MKRHWFTLMASVTIVHGLVSEKSTEQPFRPIYKDPLVQKIVYNSNNGYEPYWVDGEWYIRNPSEWASSTSVATTTIPLVCGDECPHLFTSIMHVCARENIRPQKGEFVSCESCGEHESMLKPQVEKYHKTFDTYCQFLQSACTKEDGKSYDLMHVGKCEDDIVKIYKPMSAKKEILDRLSGYLVHLNKTTTLKFDELQKFPTTRNPFG